MAQESSLAGSSSDDDSIYNDFFMHLELGAANYGPDGHTKTSQDKTVFSEFREVTKKLNYRDTLNDLENIAYRPEMQHRSLFVTIDQLVQLNGGRVVFFINDLFPVYVDDAVTKIKQYVSDRGYNSVIIEPVVGNYTAVNMTAPLAKYGRTAYDSVHLKNPEVSFYHYGIDGDDMLPDVESRSKAREKLSALAKLSCNGLYFFPTDQNNNFIPKEEYDEFIDIDIFYKKTTKWNAVPYILPEGEVMLNSYSAVYFVESKTTDAKCKGD